METNQFEDDISYIKKMIENNRRTLVDNGLLYISTGIYVLVGSTVSYILGLNGLIDWLPQLWLVLMAILITFNIITKKKYVKSEQPKTFASELFNAIWTVCGIPIALISLYYFIVGGLPTTLLFIVIGIVLGIAYYLTGIINQLTIMKVLAFGWWLGAFAALNWKYIGEEYQLSLLFAVLIFFLEIIPGIIIYRKWKEKYNE
ncbi:MAG: hypothetical protein K9J12_00945 [Melioribacteraceae bacterium]|nr:hypothetical protein [Melioribacteraceae bacterium]